MSLIDYEQCLSVFDRIAVLHANRFDDASDFRLDLVHHFHRLDNTKRVALIDLVADLDEWCCAG